MRKIQFRSYNPITKKMYYDFDQSISEVKLGKSIHQFVYENGLIFYTLEEFSGFTDIDENEIYENDFLESESGSIYLAALRKGSWVIVHNPACGSEREGECKTDYLFDAVKILKLKIIGNIHDDRELLNN